MMHDFEKDLIKKLDSESTQRRIEKVPGSRWGRLILPAPDEIAVRPSQGMKILCIGSWTLGLLTLEALLSMEKEEPEKIRVIGLITDDPLDCDAKISVNRRFWRYYPESQREEYEWGILHRALDMGIPCYTGEVKCDAFRRIMSEWNPDAIIMAAFGQVVDEPIINFPPYGIYNIHPSDLLHDHGGGPKPWEDLVERKAATARVTVHKVSPVIDNGDIVGQSPEINVLLPDGSVSDDVRMIGEKTLVPVAPMARELILALVEKKATGEKGAIGSIDFDRIFGHEFKAKLMRPLDPSKRGKILPLPLEETRYTV